MPEFESDSMPARGSVNARIWRSRLKWIVLVIAAFSPGLWMASYVNRNAVDIACWDMWENGPLLQKWQDGTLGWQDLYAPQIQHRIVVPRLIIIALSHLSGGDFRWEQMAALAMNALASVFVWVLLRRALGRTRWVYGLLFVANLLIFSPMLYQNFFWGSALWMGMPLPCLLGVLVVLGSRSWPVWLRFVVSLFLAEVATHSFSHGIVVWPVVLGYLLLQPELGPFKTRLKWSGLWAVVAAVTLGCYFHDFYNTAAHAYNLKPGDNALQGGVKLLEDGNLARVFRFFFGMFGAIFARTPFSSHLVDDAQSLGRWVIAPLALVVVWILSTTAGRRNWSHLLPWLALASYVVGVALMVSIGRAHLGEHRCALPRYFVVTLFAPVATLALVFVAVREELRARGCGGACTESARGIAIAVLAALAALQWPIWQHGLHLCRIWNDARRQARALVMFIDQPQLKPWSVETVDMDVSHWGWSKTREQVDALKKLGLFKTPVVETPELRWFQREKAALKPDKATVDAVKIADGQVIVTGNARFGSERPVDLLLLTAPGSDQVLALGVPTPKPVLRLYPLDYEFTNNADVPVGDAYRWEARLPAQTFQQAGGSLDVWALDGERMRITRLEMPAQLGR